MILERPWPWRGATRDYERRELMNGPDHYREAERLLDEATSRDDFNPRAQWCLELAKVQTALAHVAATAQASDGREWVRVAGPLVRRYEPGPA
jgi:hypothetical protein